MSASTRVQAIASVQVGTVGGGGGASAQYGVVSRERSVDRTGPDGTSGRNVREITWTLKCIAEAASNAAVATLLSTLETDLVARTGQLVTLTLFGSTMTLPAEGSTGGAAGGSMAGYPRLKLSDVAAESFGPFRTFNLEITTKIPVPDVDGLVSHAYSTTYDYDENGNETVTVSGEVTLAPEHDDSAVTWINDNVIDDARTAAEGDDRPFTSKIIQPTLDEKTATYTHVTKPIPLVTGSGAQDERSVTRLAKDRRGRITLIVTGSSKGDNATAFATSQKPTLSGNQILTRDEVTDPQIPDGRVDFSYEVTNGVVDSNLADRAILSYTEGRGPTGGGRALVLGVYQGDDPIQWRGPKTGYFYQQSTTIEHLGPAFTTAEILDRLLFDPDTYPMQLDFVPEDQSQGPNGVWTTRFTATFWSATAIDPLPSPYTVPGLT